MTWPLTSHTLRLPRGHYVEWGRYRWVASATPLMPEPAFHLVFNRKGNQTIRFEVGLLGRVMWLDWR